MKEKRKITSSSSFFFTLCSFSSSYYFSSFIHSTADKRQFSSQQERTREQDILAKNTALQKWPSSGRPSGLSFREQQHQKKL